MLVQKYTNNKNGTLFTTKPSCSYLFYLSWAPGYRYWDSSYNQPQTISITFLGVQYSPRPQTKLKHPACAIRDTHHNSGELNESKTTVQLCLLILDDTDIGGGKNSIWGQRAQNGIHRTMRIQVPQDDGCWQKRGHGKHTDCFRPPYSSPPTRFNDLLGWDYDYSLQCGIQSLVQGL